MATALIEDWFVFQHHLCKPVFIRFVVSGNYFYAVVYRGGISKYDESMLKEALRTHSEAVHKYTEQYDLKVNYQSHTKADGDINFEAVQKEFLTKKKRSPGLGPFMMKQAGLLNLLLAQNLTFGFYAGHRQRDAGLLKLMDKWPPF
jgi:hypothetical protein